MNLRICIIVAIVFVQAQNSFAQLFRITRAERVAGSIVLHYDLIDTVSSRTYTVYVYSSADNFISPLQKINGDAGLEVRPGGNRKITWDASGELGADFKGPVRLEVRGKVYVPFVKLDAFDDYKKFKRNRDYKITWTGGRGNNVLNFDLYRGDKKVTSYPNIANVGYHTLRFQGIKPGGSYRLRISDSKNKDDVVYSAPFQIRRKVPLMLKAVPVAGLGYLVYTLTAKGMANNAIIDPPEPE